MAIPGTIKSYKTNGNSFIEDPAGHLRGIEWQKPNGNSFRVICTGENRRFSISDRDIDFTFIKEMKEDTETEWFFKNKYHLDQTEYINTNFGNAKYGKVMANPFLADGVTLKPNTKSFVDYFFDILYLQLTATAPIALAITLCDIAAAKENVTLP